MNEIELIKNRKTRIELARRSFKYFFLIYFSKYVQYKTPDFHEELFNIIEDENPNLSVIVAFRGSAKSTMITLAYAIWSIISNQKKRYVLIVSKTQQQVKIHLQNIKSEIENNTLLNKDFGNLKIGNMEWSATSITIEKYHARIKAVSSETAIRGTRHLEKRPDLILVDDAEDMDSVRSLEARDKNEKWLTSEIIPVGDKDTKIIIIGNLLHNDSLLMRLKQKIEKSEMIGNFRAYPLVKDGNILWPDKFKTEEDIEILRKQVANNISFKREYLLEIVDDADKLIPLEKISYYDKLPEEMDLIGIVCGVDLAISKEATADCTAITSVAIYENKNQERFYYVLDNIFNKKVNFTETKEEIRKLFSNLKSTYDVEIKIFIESVGYQKSLIEELEKEGLPVEAFLTKGKDKRSRLSLSVYEIENKQILFPKENSKDLVYQIVDFGSEKHDDLADAFSMAIIESKKIERYSEPEIFIV